MTKIISAFPACGKSHAYNLQKVLKVSIEDVDSSEFSWIDNNGRKERNPEFPLNYITHIKSLVGKVDYIFVSYHEEVRSELDKSGLPYILVKPDIKLQNEWLGRCWSRGDDEGFLITLKQMWWLWLSTNDTRFMCKGVCTLDGGEYLADKIHWFETFSGV